MAQDLLEALIRPTLQSGIKKTWGSEKVGNSLFSGPIIRISNPVQLIYQFRIYHTEVSSGKKWVWRPDGYSPSEPFFVSNPMPTAEDDGVVVTLASPMSTERDDLEPFFAILNGRDLTELARAYLPKGYTVPVGFHGIYVQAEKP